MPEFVKRREPPRAGSIAAALDIFRSEVRFYREIAPVVGIRVPACYQADDSDDGTVLVLEDLSAWHPGADPVQAAMQLRELHERWSGLAAQRWPWLRPVGAAAHLVAELYERTRPALDGRADLPPQLRELTKRLAGNVIASELAIEIAGPLTLTHGDASLANMRTSDEGELALLDWEDVSAAPGICDLAWLLVSSVPPAQWDATIEAYGSGVGLAEVLPATAVQGLLSLSGEADGSAAAAAWIARLDGALEYLRLSSHRR
jgi:hypothetical protein